MDQKEYIDIAVQQCAVTELWSQLDYDTMEDENDNAEPFDSWATTDDLTDGAWHAIRTALEDFIVANWADLVDMNPEQCGHDFALTRNGHGAGFWDRGLGEKGERLTAACKPYGESHYYRVTDPETGQMMVDSEY